LPCPDSRFDCKRRSRRLLIDVKGSLGRDCIASIYLFATLASALLASSGEATPREDRRADDRSGRNHPHAAAGTASGRAGDAKATTVRLPNGKEVKIAPEDRMLAELAAITHKLKGMYESRTDGAGDTERAHAEPQKVRAARTSSSAAARRPPSTSAAHASSSRVDPVAGLDEMRRKLERQYGVSKPTKQTPAAAVRKHTSPVVATINIPASAFSGRSGDSSHDNSGYANQSHVSGVTERHDSDNSSEDSHAGEKSIHVAVAEMAKQEVHRQLERMFPHSHGSSMKSKESENFAQNIVSPIIKSRTSPTSLPPTGHRITAAARRLAAAAPPAGKAPVFKIGATLSGGFGDADDESDTSSSTSTQSTPKVKRGAPKRERSRSRSQSQSRGKITSPFSSTESMDSPMTAQEAAALSEAQRVLLMKTLSGSRADAARIISGVSATDSSPKSLQFDTALQAQAAAALGSPTSSLGGSTLPSTVANLSAEVGAMRKLLEIVYAEVIATKTIASSNSNPLSYQGTAGSGEEQQHSPLRRSGSPTRARVAASSTLEETAPIATRAGQALDAQSPTAQPYDYDGVAQRNNIDLSRSMRSPATPVGSNVSQADMRTPRINKRVIATVTAHFEGDAAQHQMSVVEGEKLIILQQLESGWWYAHRIDPETGRSRKTGRVSGVDFGVQGYVPGGFLSVDNDVEYQDDVGIVPKTRGQTPSVHFADPVTAPSPNKPSPVYQAPLQTPAATSSSSTAGVAISESEAFSERSSPDWVDRQKSYHDLLQTANAMSKAAAAAAHEITAKFSLRPAPTAAAPSPTHAREAPSPFSSPPPPPPPVSPRSLTSASSVGNNTNTKSSNNGASSNNSATARAKSPIQTAPVNTTIFMDEEEDDDDDPPPPPPPDSDEEDEAEADAAAQAAEAQRQREEQRKQEKQRLAAATTPAPAPAPAPVLSAASRAASARRLAAARVSSEEGYGSDAKHVSDSDTAGRLRAVSQPDPPNNMGGITSMQDLHAAYPGLARQTSFHMSPLPPPPPTSDFSPAPQAGPHPASPPFGSWQGAPPEEYTSPPLPQQPVVPGAVGFMAGRPPSFRMSPGASSNTAHLGVSLYSNSYTSPPMPGVRPHASVANAMRDSRVQSPPRRGVISPFSSVHEAASQASDAVTTFAMRRAASMRH
jgi:hypothetical protein